MLCMGINKEKEINPFSPGPHPREFRTQEKICWVDVSILPTIKMLLQWRSLSFYLKKYAWQGMDQLLFLICLILDSLIFTFCGVII